MNVVCSTKVVVATVDSFEVLPSVVSVVAIVVVDECCSTMVVITVDDIEVFCSVTRVVAVMVDGSDVPCSVLLMIIMGIVVLSPGVKVVRVDNTEVSC